MYNQDLQVLIERNTKISLICYIYKNDIVFYMVEALEKKIKYIKFIKSLKMFKITKLSER